MPKVPSTLSIWASMEVQPVLSSGCSDAWSASHRSRSLVGRCRFRLNARYSACAIEHTTAVRGPLVGLQAAETSGDVSKERQQRDCPICLPGRRPHSAHDAERSAVAAELTDR